MSLPANWSTVEVRVGPYRGSNGDVLEGQVEFSPRPNRLVDLDQTMIIRRKTFAELDSNGEGAVQLPINNDADVSPTGWTWFVKERFLGGGGDSYDIEVTSADIGAGVDLSERAPEPIVAFGEFRNAFRTEMEALKDAASAIAGADTADDLIVALDADAGSTFRQQQDARVASTYVAITKRPVALRDVAGLNFNDSGDSQATLQAAINAAGAGATIEWGRPGVIRCASGITLLEHQTLSGAGDYLGAGGTPAAALNFPSLTGSQVAVTGGGNNVLRDLLVRGPMTGANSTYGFKSASGAPRFQNVSFTGFAIGCALTDAFYSSFDTCEFARNKYGLVLTNVYNLGLVNTRFYCQYGPGDASFGFGIDGGGRPLNIYGGAIEGYGSGGAIKLYAGQVVNLWGTYFESAGPNAWGVVADASQVTVMMKGCFIYLTDHNRFVSMTGATSAVIDASGNKFVCPTSSTTAPIAYSLPNTTAVKGSVGPDSWAEVAKVGTVHLNPIPSGIRYMAP